MASSKSAGKKKHGLRAALIANKVVIKIKIEIEVEVLRLNSVEQ